MRLLSIALLVLMCIPLLTSSGILEDELLETVDRINKARGSGAEVEDLVQRTNQAIQEMESCGWESCDQDSREDFLRTMDEIQREAIERTRMISNTQFYTILLLVSIAGLTYSQYRYHLWQKLQWWLIKDRQIDYREENNA